MPPVEYADGKRSLPAYTRSSTQYKNISHFKRCVQIK